MRAASGRLIPFLLAASVVLTAFGSSSIGRLRSDSTFVRFIPLALMGGWAIVAAIDDPARARRRLLSPFSLGFLVFALLALASTAWSVDGHRTLERAPTLLLLFGGIAAVLLYAETERQVRELLVGISLGVAVVFVLSGIQALVDWNAAFQPAFTSARGGSIARFHGITEDPNTIAAYGVVALPIVLWLAYRSRSAERIGWIALALGIGAGVIASSSRAPAAIAALEAAIFIVVTIPRRSVRLAVIGVAVLALVVGAVGAATSHSFRVRVARVQTLGDAGGRTEAWHAAAHLIRAKPVLGYGYSTEVTVFGRYRAAHHQQFDRVGFAADAVHNSYLGLALQLGIVGALLGTALLLVPLASLLRRGLGDPALRLALALALGGAVLDALLSSYFYSVGNVLTVSLWTIAAAAYAVSER